MNEGLLKAELNNLAAFFNDETAYIHVPDEIYNSSKEDTWTTFLNAYLSNDQKIWHFVLEGCHSWTGRIRKNIMEDITIIPGAEGSNAEIHRLMVRLIIQKYLHIWMNYWLMQ